jgi:hypothetical protein
VLRPEHFLIKIECALQLAHTLCVIEVKSALKDLCSSDALCILCPANCSYRDAPVAVEIIAECIV